MDKPKKKRSPHRRRLLRLAIIAIVNLLLGIVLYAQIEPAITRWLDDDPFTPICHIPNLEITYESNDRDNVYLNRMRLNGENPKVVDQVDIKNGFKFYWTTDYSHLVYSSAINPDIIQVVDSKNDFVGHWKADYEFNWLITPDRKTVVILPVESDGAIWITTGFLVEDPTSGHIITLDATFAPDFNVPQLGNWMSLSEKNYAPYVPEAHQVKFSPDEKYVATTQKTKGLSQTTTLTVREIETDALIWIFWKTGYDMARTDVTIEYIIHDISQSNDLLYSRRYYSVDGNTNVNDLPDEFFIADIEHQNVMAIGIEHIIRDLKWSPNNTAMFIALEKNKTVEIYLGDVDGANRKLVTTLQSDVYNLKNFHWTPDGQYLSYENKENHWIYLMNLETHERCRVVKGRTDDWSTAFDWRLVNED